MAKVKYMICLTNFLDNYLYIFFVKYQNTLKWSSSICGWNMSSNKKVLLFKLDFYVSSVFPLLSKHCCPVREFFLNKYKYSNISYQIYSLIQKSRIRETKHLSTDADSSTDTKTRPKVKPMAYGFLF